MHKHASLVRNHKHAAGLTLLAAHTANELRLWLSTKREALARQRVEPSEISSVLTCAVMAVALQRENSAQDDVGTDFETEYLPVVEEVFQGCLQPLEPAKSTVNLLKRSEDKPVGMATNLPGVMLRRSPNKAAAVQ